MHKTLNGELYDKVCEQVKLFDIFVLNFNIFFKLLETKHLDKEKKEGNHLKENLK